MVLTLSRLGMGILCLRDYSKQPVVLLLTKFVKSCCAGLDGKLALSYSSIYFLLMLNWQNGAITNSVLCIYDSSSLCFHSRYLQLLLPSPRMTI